MCQKNNIKELTSHDGRILVLFKSICSVDKVYQRDRDHGDEVRGHPELAKEQKEDEKEGNWMDGWMDGWMDN